MTDDQVCIPLTDESGEVVARARVSADLNEAGRQALQALVEAVRKDMAERDAADFQGTSERARRYDAGQRRIKARLKRLRGEP